MEKKKIKVLVVDDSFVFREAIIRGIMKDPEIEVVAKAGDPFEARDKILEFEPDVMTCDVEMPKMNGIDFVKRLLPQYPIPVVMVSGISGSVFDAMKAGVVDFVVKPYKSGPEQIQLFIDELIRKIKIAAASKVTLGKNNTSNQILEAKNLRNDKIVAIGASTGGTEAISKILVQLPSDFPGIVVVQHIPPMFSRMFAERLNNQTKLHVKEAETGDYIEQGKVLVAPGDQHILVKRIGTRFRIEAFYGEKVNGHCPSVDVLFDSIAKEVADKAIGVILTGMGNDGAKGLLAMRRQGAHTIGQDEISSVVYGMPKVAYDIGAVEKQMALSNISNALINMLK
ncbi:chemotaxis response regulator protein-glutamate methylesterase [Mobilitalea sibirica]|uniref:Protein-glutamate methylesterase/protein-glutamine glutaminase n=1 Tax=Mobilitalea sibirica TaxID=1462919 RepID=A0A8J7H4P7_9FIRM|nr:chemotaxis response regulator protein-glutamate methylesterase [Mobilitalea sibirica]MBH1939586.1 chemotaxis response regulator protein-glutamate methylesterase [Mobilitalea sibirica]